MPHRIEDLFNEDPDALRQRTERPIVNPYDALLTPQESFAMHNAHEIDTLFEELIAGNRLPADVKERLMSGRTRLTQAHASENLWRKFRETVLTTHYAYRPTPMEVRFLPRPPNELGASQSAIGFPVAVKPLESGE